MGKHKGRGPKIETQQLEGPVRKLKSRRLSSKVQELRAKWENTRIEPRAKWCKAVVGKNNGGKHYSLQESLVENIEFISA